MGLNSKSKKSVEKSGKKKPKKTKDKTKERQDKDTKQNKTDFLDFFAHLRVKSNEALDVDEIFLEE